jgi:putative nucleotidyltransferase with HDIG domain
MLEANVVAALTRIRSIVTYPLRHVRGRIILPFAVLTLLLAAAGSYLVTNLVTGSLQERFDNQLVEAGRVVADETARTEQRQLADVRAMSATQGVAAATDSGDEGQVHALLDPQIRNAHVEWAAATDAEGRLVYATAQQPGQSGQYAPVTAGSIGDWWPLQQALKGTDARGDKYASLVETDQGFVLMTAAPVYAGGRIAGAVLVGTYADSLVAQLKSQSLGDVTVYDYTGLPIASTLVADESRTAVLRVPGAQLTAILNAPQDTNRGAVRYAGRDFDVAYGLLSVRGNVIGVYSVALSTTYLATAAGHTRLELALFVAIAIGAVLIVGYLISTRITDPILALVGAARRLSAGDLDTRSDVHTVDEIGVLATTFDNMAESLQDYSGRLRRQYLGTVKALTAAIDARDPYTLGHSLRVGQLGRALGAELGLSESVLGEVEVGGYLHDVGKIGVRDAVLLKPGQLTPEERIAIERHPTIGLSILASVEVSREVLDIVGKHHERLDGSGYPDGLRGDDVDMVVRIAAAADVYDALMSKRPYKPSMSCDEVLAWLRAKSNTLFDERVVDALVRIAPAWEERVENDPNLRGVDLGESTVDDVRRAA